VGFAVSDCHLIKKRQTGGLAGAILLESKLRMLALKDLDQKTSSIDKPTRLFFQNLCLALVNLENDQVL